MSKITAATLVDTWEAGAPRPLLERALVLLAAVAPERSLDGWAAASIGERDAELVRLRAELFGTEIDAIGVCPRCGSRVEVEFTTADVTTPRARSTPVHVTAQGFTMRARLPTTDDVLALVDVPADDRASVLLGRCVIEASADGHSVGIELLPAVAVSALGEAIAAADPQADVQIEMACPECTHRWAEPFDIVRYVWDEIEDWVRRLVADVHTLATAYGWSEVDILSMSARRRQMYVDAVRG